MTTNGDLSGYGRRPVRGVVTRTKRQSLRAHRCTAAEMDGTREREKKKEKKRNDLGETERKNKVTKARRRDMSYVHIVTVDGTVYRQ